ncbi:MAG: hypothetical protein OXI91_15390 [Chloroflexota bacterium]|nr:hypothetical protein [Chloroflexota bacterium]
MSVPMEACSSMTSGAGAGVGVGTRVDRAPAGLGAAVAAGALCWAAGWDESVFAAA